MNAPQFTEGSEVLSWGRHGSRCANFRSGGCRFSVPIWIGKKYKAIPRKSDGVLTWRLVLTFGPSVSGSRIPRTVTRYVLERAKETGETIHHVQHGQRVAQ